MARKPEPRKTKKISRKSGQDQTRRKHSATATPNEPRVLDSSFPIVGVGASAGGLEAFTAFLQALPANTGMAFVLIQHMDPTHESVLGSLLQKSTAMPVVEVADGMVVEPNHIYTIPPNALMTISKRVLALTSRKQQSFRELPIDPFLPFASR